MLAAPINTRTISNSFWLQTELTVQPQLYLWDYMDYNTENLTQLENVASGLLSNPIAPGENRLLVAQQGHCCWARHASHPASADYLLSRGTCLGVLPFRAPSSARLSFQSQVQAEASPRLCPATTELGKVHFCLLPGEVGFRNLVSVRQPDATQMCSTTSGLGCLGQRWWTYSQAVCT